MKGLLVFYVNFPTESEKDVTETLALTKEFNKDWINEMHELGDYQVMFVPTIGEASRVEKIDFDQPFPRYVLPHVDVLQNEKVVSDITSLVEEEGD